MMKLDTPTTPFLNGAAIPQEHPILDDENTTLLNDLLLKAEKRIYNAQRMSYWTMGALCVALAVIAVLALSKKETYYSMTHNQTTGQPVLATALVSEAHSLTTIKLELARFITDLRSVNSDPAWVDKNNTAFYMARTPAQTFIRSEFSQEKPGDLLKRGVARGVRDIRVEHVEQTGLTFALSWTEDRQETSVNKVSDWTATIVVELISPNELKSEDRKVSPFGIFVNSATWTSRERN